MSLRQNLCFASSIWEILSLSHLKAPNSLNHFISLNYRHLIEIKQKFCINISSNFPSNVETLPGYFARWIRWIANKQKNELMYEDRLSPTREKNNRTNKSFSANDNYDSINSSSMEGEGGRNKSFSQAITSPNAKNNKVIVKGLTGEASLPLSSQSCFF